MNSLSIEAIIESVRSGLVARRLLRSLVIAIIAGGSFLCAGIFALMLGCQWWILLPGPVVFCIVLALGIATSGISKAEAGLFIDKRFGLKERFVSVVTLGDRRGAFAESLIAETCAAASAIDRREIFSGLWPSYASYAAIPVALAIVLTIAAPDLDSDSTGAGNKTSIASTGGNQVKEVAGNKKTADAITEKDLIAALEEAGGKKLSAEELRQMLAQLKAEMKDPNSIGEHGRMHGQKDGEDSGQGEGIGDSGGIKKNRSFNNIVRLQTVLQKAKNILRTNRGDTETTTSDSPDWDEYARIEASIPVDHQEGVRRYLNSLNSN